MPIPASGDEPEAWISLDLIAGLGAESIRRLLQRFGIMEFARRRPP